MTDEKQSPVPVKQVLTGSWKELGLRWVFEQSIVVILLLGILAATYYGIPNVALPRIEAGYRANAESMKETMKLVVDANKEQTTIFIEASKEQMKLILETHDRDRQSFERAMDRNK